MQARALEGAAPKAQKLDQPLMRDKRFSE